jgi:hypothetical protein
MESIQKNNKLAREPQTVSTLSDEEISQSGESLDSDVVDKQYMEREIQMKKIKH